MIGMRRTVWIAAIVLCLSVIVSACGMKDAGSIVKDLDEKVGKLQSYAATGQMTLHTGQQEQAYQVEVWFKDPHFYRIALTNDKKDVTQIVLRNEEGVFVLTPQLNKSFRFQSNWPENQGQVYLYQSLVQSIVDDQNRHFASEKDAYVFDVAANYPNASLARQKIWLSKKDYAPQLVQVSDENAKLMVTVNFAEFQFDRKFDKDSFDMQRNMTSSALQTLPTAGQTDAAGKDKAAGGDKAAAGSGANGNTGKDGAAPAGGKSAAADFGVIEPSYVPEGVGRHPEVAETKLGGEKAVLLRYSGTYSYTILESRPKEQAALAPEGKLVNLGFADFGLLTGEDKKTLIWMNDGVEFRLSSGDLTESELVKIAQSVQGEIGK